MVPVHLFGILPVPVVPVVPAIFARRMGDHQRTIVFGETLLKGTGKLHLAMLYVDTAGLRELSRVVMLHTHEELSYKTQ